MKVNYPLQNMCSWSHSLCPQGARLHAQVLAEEPSPDAAWERMAQLQRSLQGAAPGSAPAAAVVGAPAETAADAAGGSSAAAGAQPAPALEPELPGGGRASEELAARLRRAVPLRAAWGTQRWAPASSRHALTIFKT